jgi:3-hydroxyanthranilate 3,4-dioxygenase
MAAPRIDDFKENVMTAHPRFAPFNFQDWIERNKDNLKPPVSNKQLFDEKTGMIVMIVGGPNKRVDFHDDPVQEFFYQLKGDMLLKIAEGGKIYDVKIKEGDVFLLPPHARHSPQRPVEGSVGLVVEGARTPDMRDGFEWFCFKCGEKVHRVEVQLKDIVKDLPPLYEAFYSDEKARTCPKCGTVHPGKTPPEGWVQM